MESITWFCSQGCVDQHQFKAVLFDFDGTLVDTETSDLISWEQEFSLYGLELDRRFWLAHLGKSDHALHMLDELERLSTKPIDRNLVEQRQREREVSISMTQPLRQGIADSLEAAKTSGMRLGVVSNSSRGWVQGQLDRLEITPWFETVVTRDDVTEPKPQPESYKTALKNLGIRSDEALAFEDSVLGQLAAHRAGIACVFVPVFSVDHERANDRLTLIDPTAIAFSEIVDRAARRFSCQKRY